MKTPNDLQRKLFYFYFKADVMLFMHPLFGFNVEQFERHCYPHLEEGVSLSDAVRVEHGAAAELLLLQLITPKEG